MKAKAIFSQQGRAREINHTAGHSPIIKNRPSDDGFLALGTVLPEFKVVASNVKEHHLFAVKQAFNRVAGYSSSYGTSEGKERLSEVEACVYGTKKKAVEVATAIADLTKDLGVKVLVASDGDESVVTPQEHATCSVCSKALVARRIAGQRVAVCPEYVAGDTTHTCVSEDGKEEDEISKTSVLSAKVRSALDKLSEDFDIEITDKALNAAVAFFKDGLEFDEIVGKVMRSFGIGYSDAKILVAVAEDMGVTAGKKHTGGAEDVAYDLVTTALKSLGLTNYNSYFDSANKEVVLYVGETQIPKAVEVFEGMGFKQVPARTTDFQGDVDLPADLRFAWPGAYTGSKRAVDDPSTEPDSGNKEDRDAKKKAFAYNWKPGQRVYMGATVDNEKGWGTVVGTTNKTQTSWPFDNVLHYIIQPDEGQEVTVDIAFCTDDPKDIGWFGKVVSEEVYNSVATAKKKTSSSYQVLDHPSGGKLVQYDSVEMNNSIHIPEEDVAIHLQPILDGLDADWLSGVYDHFKLFKGVSEGMESVSKEDGTVYHTDQKQGAKKRAGNYPPSYYDSTYMGPEHVVVLPEAYYDPGHDVGWEVIKHLDDAGIVAAGYDLTITPGLFIIKLKYGYEEYLDQAVDILAGAGYEVEASGPRSIAVYLKTAKHSTKKRSTFQVGDVVEYTGDTSFNGEKGKVKQVLDADSYVVDFDTYGILTEKGSNLKIANKVAGEANWKLTATIPSEPAVVVGEFGADLNAGISAGEEYLDAHPEVSTVILTDMNGYKAIYLSQEDSYWQHSGKKATKKVVAVRYIKCPECRGSGTVETDGREYECPSCGGSGDVVDDLIPGDSRFSRKKVAYPAPVYSEEQSANDDDVIYHIRICSNFANGKTPTDFNKHLTPAILDRVEAAEVNSPKADKYFRPENYWYDLKPTDRVELLRACDGTELSFLATDAELLSSLEWSAIETFILNTLPTMTVDSVNQILMPLLTNQPNSTGSVTLYLRLRGTLALAAFIGFLDSTVGWNSCDVMDNFGYVANWYSKDYGGAIAMPYYGKKKVRGKKTAEGYDNTSDIEFGSHYIFVAEPYPEKGLNDYQVVAYSEKDNQKLTEEAKQSLIDLGMSDVGGQLQANFQSKRDAWEFANEVKHVFSAVNIWEPVTASKKKAFDIPSFQVGDRVSTTAGLVTQYSRSETGYRNEAFKSSYGKEIIPAGAQGTVIDNMIDMGSIIFAPVKFDAEYKGASVEGAEMTDTFLISTRDLSGDGTGTLGKKVSDRGKKDSISTEGVVRGNKGEGSFSCVIKRMVGGEPMAFVDYQSLLSAVQSARETGSDDWSILIGGYPTTVYQEEPEFMLTLHSAVRMHYDELLSGSGNPYRGKKSRKGSAFTDRHRALQMGKKTDAWDFVDNLNSSINFAIIQLKDGVSEDQIVSALQSGGWPEVHVEDILRRAKEHNDYYLLKGEEVPTLLASPTSNYWAKTSSENSEEEENTFIPGSKDRVSSSSNRDFSPGDRVKVVDDNNFFSSYFLSIGEEGVVVDAPDLSANGRKFLVPVAWDNDTHNIYNAVRPDILEKIASSQDAKTADVVQWSDQVQLAKQYNEFLRIDFMPKSRANSEDFYAVWATTKIVDGMASLTRITPQAKSLIVSLGYDVEDPYSPYDASKDYDTLEEAQAEADQIFSLMESGNWWEGSEVTAKSQDGEDTFDEGSPNLRNAKRKTAELSVGQDVVCKTSFKGDNSEMELIEVSPGEIGTVKSIKDGWYGIDWEVEGETIESYFDEDEVFDFVEVMG